MKGVSGRKVGEALGISEGAVRKLKASRLKEAMYADGSFDLAKAKAAYARNVDPAMQRDRPAAAAPSSDSSVGDADAGTALPSKGPDQNKARAVWTTEKALRERIKRRKDEGAVIEREKTLTLVQTLARSFRDGLLGFTDKHHTQIASELGVDAHLVYQVLDRHLLKYLARAVDKIEVDL